MILLIGGVALLIGAAAAFVVVGHRAKPNGDGLQESLLSRWRDEVRQPGGNRIRALNGLRSVASNHGDPAAAQGALSEIVLCFADPTLANDAATVTIDLLENQSGWNELVPGVVGRAEVHQATQEALGSQDLLVRKAGALLLDQPPPSLRVALRCRQPKDVARATNGSQPSRPARGEVIARLLEAQGYSVVERTTVADIGVTPARSSQETDNVDLLIQYDNYTDHAPEWEGRDAFWDVRQSCLTALLAPSWADNANLSEIGDSTATRTFFGKRACWFERGHHGVLIYVKRPTIGMPPEMACDTWRANFGPPRSRLLLEHVAMGSNEETFCITAAIVRTIHEAGCDVVDDIQQADRRLRLTRTATRVGFWVPPGNQHGGSIGGPAFALRCEIALLSNDTTIWHAAIAKKDPDDHPPGQKLLEEYVGMHASQLRAVLEQSPPSEP